MSDWQPIETVPMNVPVLLAFQPRGDKAYVWPGTYELFYRKRKPVWVDLADNPLNVSDATHWMPFPKPPALEPAGE